MNPNEPPKDHVDEDEPSRSSAFDENIRSKATWQRLLFMIIMALLFCLGVTVGNVAERLYREVRALRIYEGATEIQKLVIARALFDGK